MPGTLRLILEGCNIIYRYIWYLPPSIFSFSACPNVGKQRTEARLTSIDMRLKRSLLRMGNSNCIYYSQTKALTWNLEITIGKGRFSWTPPCLGSTFVIVEKKIMPSCFPDQNGSLGWLSWGFSVVYFGSWRCQLVTSSTLDGKNPVSALNQRLLYYSRYVYIYIYIHVCTSTQVLRLWNMEYLPYQMDFFIHSINIRILPVQPTCFEDIYPILGFH